MRPSVMPPAARCVLLMSVQRAKSVSVGASRGGWPGIGVRRSTVNEKVAAEFRAAWNSGVERACALERREAILGAAAGRR